MIRDSRKHASRALSFVALLAMTPIPQLALGQTSPFLTGANALQTNILGWLTPIAITLR